MIAVKRWSTTFLISSILWIGTIFMINFTVDPFGNRDWIVEKKYKPIVHERSEKYTAIFNQNNIQKYDCVILGSSRVMSISPSSNDATKGCYNFGVHVANNPEKLFILQEWLKRAPLKKVYLGNELYNIHTKTRPLYLNTHSFRNGSEGNYLSFSTLQISIKTLKNFLKNEPQAYFDKDGSIQYYNDEQSIKLKTFDHSYKHFRRISQDAVEGNFVKNPFAYESKALEPLKEIKVLCDRQHVKVFAFITPTFYEAQRQMQTHSNLDTATKYFKDDLTNIFGKIYDFDINTSENRTPTNFYDSVHYRHIVGNLMINRMENNGSYGIVLNKSKPQNVFTNNRIK